MAVALEKQALLISSLIISAFSILIIFFLALLAKVFLVSMPIDLFTLNSLAAILTALLFPHLRSKKISFLQRSARLNNFLITLSGIEIFSLFTIDRGREDMN